MDNTSTGAPVIPYGTQPTAYGTTLFPSEEARRNIGQAPHVPEVGKSVAVAPQQVSMQPAGQAPQITAFEELAAKKGFSNPDDLAKAYMELESRTTGVEMTLADLLRSREVVPEQTVPTVPTVKEPETPEDALRIVNSIVDKKVRPLQDKLDLQALFFRNADAQQYAVQMAKIVKDNPGVSWDIAYKAAKSDDLERKARAEGRQEAYQTQQVKMAVAAGAGGAGARPAPIDVEALVRDRSVPLAEVRRILEEHLPR